MIHINYANLKNHTLDDATIEYSSLFCCDITKSSLENTWLGFSVLKECLVENCKLDGCSLVNSYMINCNLNGSIVKNGIIYNCIYDKRCNFIDSAIIYDFGSLVYVLAESSSDEASSSENSE